MKREKNSLKKSQPILPHKKDEYIFFINEYIAFYSPVAFLNINPRFFVVHVKNIPENDWFVPRWGLGTGDQGLGIVSNFPHIYV